jgi:hypothetical protein
MALTLGEILVQEGKITTAQLDEALKSQVIFGGRLGTNLVELGFIDDAELTRALGRRFGVPCVEGDQLIGLPRKVLQLLPRELVEKYRAIPLRLENQRLTLAMANPSDLQAVDEISFLTGFIIQPVIASDLRLTQAMEVHYQIERKMRYIALSREIPRPGKPAVVDYSSAACAAPKPAPAPEEEWLCAMKTADELEAESLSSENVSRRLAEATDREDIAAQLIAWLGQQYPRAALFLVRGEMAHGWKGMVNRTLLSDFEQLEIPLDEPSVLKTLMESKSYYLGPLPRTPFNSMLLQCLGGQVPGVSLLVPLVIMGRVVGILYVDGVANPGERLFELQKLVAKTSMAFDILVLKNKIINM